MINVVVYVRLGSAACDQVLKELAAIEKEIPHRAIVVDIDKDEQLKRLYGEDVPLVQIGPFSLRGEITRERLAIALGAARDRTEHLDRIGDKKNTDDQRPEKMTFRERVSDWMSVRYIWVINVILAVFLGGAFLPPILMEAGAESAAKVIYAIYSPFCHQLPFRSYFLFGEQAYYPRELAGIPNVISYEQISGENELDIFVARDFIGNQTAGFKTALCQRDIAIFGMMLLFGIYFGITGQKTRPIRWYYLIFLGLLPMLIDGASQLKGVLVSELPDWLPLRESTPFLRTLTGGLFGLFTAWFVLPYMEESMQTTRRILARKKIIGQELSK